MAEEFLCGMGIKVVTESCYLGDFFGNMNDKYIWLADKVQGWIELVKTLPGIARKHLQPTYAGLQKSLQ